MTKQPGRHTKLSRAQKFFGALVVLLVIGVNWLNLSTAHQLEGTTDTLTRSGGSFTTVSNVGREANLIALAAAQFPKNGQFDAAALHHALFQRQLDISRASVSGIPTVDGPLAELDLRRAEMEKTFASLGTDPTQAELIGAQQPLLHQAKDIEQSAQAMYNASESDFLLKGRTALEVQRQYQIVLFVMGLFCTLVAVGLLTSLRMRAGKDLTKAYDELLVEAQERQLAEEGLRRSSDRFRALVHNASDIITVVDGDHRISYQSPSVGVLGRRAEDLIGLDFLELVDDDHRSLARAVLTESVASSGRPVKAEMKLSIGGTTRLHEVTICSLLDDPAVEGVVLNYRDVTERVHLQRQLERQAFEDVLTGLPNRAHLQDAITRISSEHDDVAVLFIDLDAFKVVNDSLGHAAGDLLLQAVAHRLGAGIREGDLLARLGGDEFTVVLTDERVDSVCALADRLISSMSEPFLLGEQVAFVGASIGIATTRDGERSPAALLRNADAARDQVRAQQPTDYCMSGSPGCPRTTAHCPGA